MGRGAGDMAEERWLGKEVWVGSGGGEEVWVRGVGSWGVEVERV